jgi:hypothetical protein
LFDGAHSAAENTRISAARLANSLIHPALLLSPPPPPPLEREEDVVPFVAASFGRGFVKGVVGCVRSLEKTIIDGRRFWSKK